MKEKRPTFKAAVVQTAPVLFDREATVEKVRDWTSEAVQHGAKLILFPEAYIPAYPRGLSFGTVVGSRTYSGRRDWERYWNNAVDVPGPTTKALGEIAREHGIYLAIGVIERGGPSAGSTLYCTLLYFGPNGNLLGKHRKLKPTAAERLIWGEGDGSTLTAIQTDLGIMGGLICWENYMPLARMAMYDKGIELYLAPTADARDAWQSTMQHIALEGRCFVLGCNQFITKDMYPKDLDGLADLDAQPDTMCRGGSVIISPLGHILAGPLFDKEGILIADIDLSEVTRSKLDFDVTGHYARSDVFQLIINEKAQRPTSHQTDKSVS